MYFADNLTGQLRGNGNKLEVLSCFTWLRAVAFEMPLSQTEGNLEVSLVERDLGKRWLSMASWNVAVVGEVKLEGAVTEWPGLEGTSRIMKLQPPCQRQGTNLHIS